MAQRNKIHQVLDTHTNSRLDSRIHALSVLVFSGFVEKANTDNVSCYQEQYRISQTCLLKQEKVSNLFPVVACAGIATSWSISRQIVILVLVDLDFFSQLVILLNPF